MKKEWTENQKQAINTSSGALVSAAAGSGKTAVLVERIIKKITAENPIPADKLLVVTFTKAAAKEMKMRIEDRLNEECKNNPTPELIRQKIRIKNAKICTIDSFCGDLIRENFDKLGISPDFSIGEDGVLTALSDKAMKQTLNESYALKSDDFELLLEALSNNFDEGDLRKNILNICKKSDNMPFAREFLEQLIQKTQAPDSFEKAKKKILETVADKLEFASKKLFSFSQILLQDDVLKTNYYPSFINDVDNYNFVVSLCRANDYNGAFTAINNMTKVNLISAAKCQDKSLAEAAKSARSRAQSVAEKMQKLLDCDEETAKIEFEYGNRVTAALLKLTLTYFDKYAALRRENNVMTYSDVEHYALSLVCKYENGEIVKREDAGNIIERFDEVLVDEFQDTNDMQNTLFKILSEDEKKIFIVGDVKQSIYGFRGGNPKHFLHKKNTYVPFPDANENDLKCINLSANFRSRKGICDFVNFLFYIVMDGNISSLKYSPDEFLYPKAEFPETDEPQVEIGFVNTPSARSCVIQDAQNVADYILKTMENGFVTDKQTKMLRRPKYSDFAILLRNMKNAGDIYSDALNSAGIPVAYSKADFLMRTEVNILLSLLSVIENQTRDIELISVMMSPVFAFTADEIAEIRLAKKKASIYSALNSFAASGNQKAEKFISLIKHFKTCFITMSISELITEIFDETDMLNIVSVFENGETRRKNLLMLQSMAGGYENGGFAKNISAFIEYIKGMNEKIKSSSNANQDAVKIITIHESKGLQFPICIIANTTQAFNSSDNGASMLIDEEFGAALRFNSDDFASKRQYITQKAILQNSLYERTDEELRLLYVALTRAEEKLFISVSTSKVESFLTDYSACAENSENLDNYREYMPEINCYADIIRYAVSVHPDMAAKMNEKGCCGFVADTESKIKFTFKDSKDIVLPQINDEITEEEVKIDGQLAAEIESGIKYKYVYEEIRGIESKAAVAEIAHKAEKRDFSFISKPAFMMKKGLTPAARGTATHRFMQFCDFERASEDILNEADRLYEYEYITQKERDAIDLGVVSQFFKSELYQRIKSADRVEREMRFLTEIPAGSLKSDLPENIKNEKVVVQGAVDCVFVENGQLVIVDFKTDRVKKAEDLSKAYETQLKIYAKACSKIFEMPVKEMLIYSFSLSKSIKI